jgi:hypothetical protein
MKSPVYVVSLYRIREAFYIKDCLIKHNGIGENVVTERKQGVPRGADIRARLNPAIDFDLAGRPIDGLHQRVDICVRSPNIGRAAIRPISIGEGRRVQRRWRYASRRFRAVLRGSFPIVTIKLEQFVKKSAIFCRWECIRGSCCFCPRGWRSVLGKDKQRLKEDVRKN